ncbi:putative ribonuclease H-like domain, reverse transcriptase zinc-binding domain-containing protein [Rosa chinensis]|uniref:Putative ribonuclease H-like domain, reverse transcriptase zinc-binding domain-containing protein n=1 Tax=Rosa chinensis TaxID=74649 RepID=A0A2P6QWT3_ROSCH|nr:putative ribonuclease H-like domain, reverse transcriptase zinc-binding domain-containing protein [Rosa chinensis]
MVQDKMIWHYDSKGRFSTKSAYRLALTLLHPTAPGSSNSSLGCQLWKQIWFAKVPGKIKIHTWRVCSSILPTISTLQSRHVFIDNGCYFCNTNDETIEHISRDCWFVRDLFKLFPEFDRIFREVLPSMSITSWLQFCLEILSQDEFALLLVLLWSIWKERNQRLWSRKFKTLHQVYFQVRNFVQLLKSSTSRRSRGVVRPRRSWLPPPSGWLKANIDGAFNQDSHCGGIGVLIRDSTGSIVGGFCGKISNVLSPDIVEAMAGREACELAAEFQLAPIVFESDCLKLVEASKCDEEDGSGFGRIVEDIRFLLSSTPSAFFSHVFRESNLAAHKLV